MILQFMEVECVRQQAGIQLQHRVSHVFVQRTDIALYWKEYGIWNQETLL